MDAQQLHRGRLIDHGSLIARDLEATKCFYDSVLAVLPLPQSLVSFVRGSGAVEAGASAGLIGSGAVAVYDHQGKAVGAINVTGHASIFADGGPQVERIELQLKATARAMSEALGYRGWSSDQM